jgi:hypothetical protein
MAFGQSLQKQHRQPADSNRILNSTMAFGDHCADITP